MTLRILTLSLLVPLTPALAAQTDPCGDWETLSPPTPGGATQAWVEDIVVVGPDAAYAVLEVTMTDAGGSTTQTSVSRWDGTVWQTVFTPPAGRSLDAIDATAPDDVWAAGARFVPDALGFPVSQPYVVRFDGAAWVEQDTPLSPALGTGGRVTDVEAIGPDLVWFAGQWSDPSCAASMGLALVWDGSGYTVHPTPTTCSDSALMSVQGYELSAMSANGPDDIWAVGGERDADPATTPYVIRYDGSTWSLVDAPNPGFSLRFHDVEAIATDDAWAVGYYKPVGSGAHVELALHWDGAAWTQVSIPDNITALHAFGPDDVYGAGPGIFRWDGGSWTLVQDFPQLATFGFGALDAAEPCQIYAAGGSNFANELLVARQAGVGAPYCESTPNSTGAPATIAGLGSANVAQNDFSLAAAGLPSSVLAIFFFGPDQARAPFGDGFRCVGGTIRRLQPVLFSSGGAVQLAVDTTAPPALGWIVAGTRHNFQCVYRDVLGPGASGFNTSHGLHVEFQ